MMQVILDFINEVVQQQSITSAGNVLEVGSRCINGTVRTILQNKATNYTGIDIEPGDCVDLIINGEDLLYHFPPGYFDTVVCCETLEHTVRPWIIVEKMKTVLKLGGHLWISTPTFGFPEHKFPIDCYRFGEDAYRHWLFADMKLLDLKLVYDELNQPAIVAVGKKIL